MQPIIYRGNWELSHWYIEKPCHENFDLISSQLLLLNNRIAEETKLNSTFDAAIDDIEQQINSVSTEIDDIKNDQRLVNISKELTKYEENANIIDKQLEEFKNKINDITQQIETVFSKLFPKRLIKNDC